jgi:uncharacterized membrane protein
VIKDRILSIATCLQKANLQYEPIEFSFFNEIKTFAIGIIRGKILYVKLGRAASAERTNLRRIISIQKKRTILREFMERKHLTKVL